MTVHVALLRAINLGNHQRVAMPDLRRLLTELGFTDVQTLLQTGNLVFRSDELNAAELEQLLEAQAEDRLGLSTDFLTRTGDELDAIIAANPFLEEAERDPAHLVVMFLKSEPEATAVVAVQDAITGRETVRAEGKHLYIVYPDGIGRSRLTTSVIERTLGFRGTGRNWNTVLKLATMTRG